MSFKSVMRNIILSLLSFFILFLLLDILIPLDTKRLFKPQSTRIYDSNHELLRIKLSCDGYYRFSSKPDEIPELLKMSVLNFEDRYFYWHWGVNPIALGKALFHNLTSNRKIGASTITMQIARMMHHKQRTVSQKLAEIFTAFQIEWHYSKDEILAIYFNLAPYGGNIDGIKTAAWFYYQKPLSALSIAEIATLTTVPKNPNANRPDIAKNLYAKRLRVLRLLLQEKLINKEQFNRAFKEPLVKKRYKAPFKAPHFASHMQETGDIFSSLDQNIQAHLLKTLKLHVDKLLDFNLHNGAAVIIHNPSMKVVAYVGSDRFFNTKNLGQNNGVTMIRSPGSSLKPFIYAKALDQGLITPQKELFDLPLHLKGYDPQNFTKTFLGEVSAETALQDSLNIPAVELNHQLGKDSLFELLRKADVKSLNQEKHYYGESIALGGFGISLLDLAHLYSSFANHGNLKSLGFKADHQSKILTKLFSKEAAYITTEMLSNAMRPEFSSYWESSNDMVRVAFKTGTSAKSKDLYTIGVTPEYTVALWMGNFSGNATKDLTGMDTSSRTLFELYAFLAQHKKISWFKQPPSVISQEVCTDAIKLGSCKNRQEDYTIKGLTLRRPCQLLRAEVLAFLSEKKAISLDDMLKHPCYESWLSYPPLISSLYDKQVIIRANQGFDDFQKVPLKCYTFKQNQAVTWMIDDNPPFKSFSAQEISYKLKTGEHTISCLDNESMMSEITLQIKEE